MNINKNLIEKLVNSKSVILNYWQMNNLSTQALTIHKINPSFFIKHFGVRILNYYIDICKGEREVGNCPEVIVMIDFFKTKKLPLEDIFLICNGFKNSLMKFLFETNQADFESVSSALSIFELNFYGIIKKYIIIVCNDRSYCDYYLDIDSVDIKHHCNSNIDKEEINNVEIDEYDLIDLNDIEEDINSIASKITFEHFNISLIKELGVKLESYGTIICKYHQYLEFGKALKELGYFMIMNYQKESISKNLDNLSFLIECFINDLILWKNETVSNNDLAKEHLIKSLISNTKQIICVIEDVSDENSIELY
ncbi:MAG: hypothetical protein HXX81_02950 [Campylobacterales bacterium]|nr:hypothetical protein [Campylobacterales bacterium]